MEKHLTPESDETSLDVRSISDIISDSKKLNGGFNY
jgi:hypothetical protein